MSKKLLIWEKSKISNILANRRGLLILEGIVFIVALLLFGVVMVSAQQQVAYYSMSTNTSSTVVDDAGGTCDLSETGSLQWSGAYPTFNVTGTGAPYSLWCDGSSEGSTSCSPIQTLDDDYTILLWINGTLNNDYNTFWMRGTWTAGGFGVRYQASGDARVVGDLYSAGYVISTTETDNGQWHHIAIRYKESTTTMVLYIDGVVESNDTTAGTNTAYATSSGLCRRVQDNDRPFTGNIDEFRLFDYDMTTQQIHNMYNCNNETTCVVPQDIRVSQEQVFQEINTISQTISAASYNAVTSSILNITPQSNYNYFSAVIPLISSASNTATCKIDIDGDDEDSEASRTNTAGEAGSFHIITRNLTLTDGLHTVELQCKKTGAGNYIVQNSVLIGHTLTDFSNRTMNAQYNAFTAVMANDTLIGNYTFTTTNNATNNSRVMSLILEYDGIYTYTGDGLINTTIEVAGQNCSAMPRYGTTGSKGSLSCNCFVYNVTANTTYDVKVFGDGAGNATLKAHIKEVIVTPTDINSTPLKGITIDNALSKLAEVSLFNNELGNFSIFAKTGISFESNDAQTIGQFKIVLSGDGSGETPIYNRTVDLNEPGVVILQTVFENLSTGTYNVELWGLCDNCTIKGGDFLAYTTIIERGISDIFLITAINNYTGTPITNFNVSVFNTTLLSNSSGVVQVFTGETLINFTINLNDYFSDVVINHNHNNDYEGSLFEYTRVFVSDGTDFINIFNANHTPDFATYSAGVSGYASLPLFNDTYVVSVYDVTDGLLVYNDGQNASVIANPYLENLTIIVNITLGCSSYGICVDNVRVCSSGVGNFTSLTLDCDSLAFTDIRLIGLLFIIVLALIFMAFAFNINIMGVIACLVGIVVSIGFIEMSLYYGLIFAFAFFAIGMVFAFKGFD